MYKQSNNTVTTTNNNSINNNSKSNQSNNTTKTLLNKAQRLWPPNHQAKRGCVPLLPSTAELRQGVKTMSVLIEVVVQHATAHLSSRALLDLFSLFSCGLHVVFKGFSYFCG